MTQDVFSRAAPRNEDIEAFEAALVLFCVVRLETAFQECADAAYDKEGDEVFTEEQRTELRNRRKTAGKLGNKYVKFIPAILKNKSSVDFSQNTKERSSLDQRYQATKTAGSCFRVFKLH